MKDDLKNRVGSVESKDGSADAHHLQQKRICPYCGYVWQSRISNPKSCPFCKRYFKKRGRNEKKRHA